MRRLRGISASLLLWLLPLSALPQSFIPKDLDGWQSWVLQDRPFLRCPFFANTDGTLKVNLYSADGIHPDDAGGYERIDGGDGRIEGDRAGQVMQAQVEADAGLQQILDLFIRFRAAESGVQPGQDQFGDFQAEGPGDFATDKLSYQCLDSLTCTAEFEYIEESIVGFGDGRQ